MERVDKIENNARPLSVEEGARESLLQAAFDKNSGKGVKENADAMSEKQVNENAQKLAECVEAIAKAKSQATDSHAALAMQEMKQLCQEAEQSDQLKELIAQTNKQLNESDAGASLRMHSQHKQDRIWPELSPFNSWNHYTIDVQTSTAKPEEVCSFDGKVTHHPGINRSDSLPQLQF